ncbi:cytochrome-c peroxidase [Roseomonas marmotae]|uniref:C-type cytochrome n=1 Tax=Roseomonas marmotae TaxID=2768161 RepID=A0ABS3K8A1_9PROT|nr:cytochrome c peroxidase [Roseomonas marmotae]MBO1073688.1 c-type cytochrome [Roseomonas marmotae]QTI78670.1 c-type cytochrome [Roseomonas marmotae]
MTERWTARPGWVALRHSVLMLGLLLATPAVPADHPEQQAIRPIQLPELDGRKVELGSMLFRDARLSGTHTLSCSSCHMLDHGGADGIERPVGASGRRHDFNTPSIFNAALNPYMNWRGNQRDLQRQSEAVLLHPDLMDGSWSVILPRLQVDADYQRRFRAAYGQEPRREAILDALVQFQRSLVTPDAPFDRYLRGDEGAIGEAAKKGFLLFRDYGCIACHQGRNIGGNLFQRFGVFPPAEPATEDSQPADLGRFLLTGREEDRYLFRVPSLRNVAETAPYFHDGRQPLLGEAVRLMGQRQLGRELLPEEVTRIVAFLQTLTGTYAGEALRSLPARQDR